MAKALPARPNLDWLRKTAKQALREMRVQQPQPVSPTRSFGRAQLRFLELARAQGARRQTTETRNGRARRRHGRAIPARCAHRKQRRRAGRPPCHADARRCQRSASALGWSSATTTHGNRREESRSVRSADRGGRRRERKQPVYEGWSPLMLTEHNEQSGMREELLKRGATVVWPKRLSSPTMVVSRSSSNAARPQSPFAHPAAVPGCHTHERLTRSTASLNSELRSTRQMSGKPPRSSK